MDYASVCKRFCNKFAVVNHIHLGLVIRLGTGRPEKHLSLMLVRSAHGRVDSCQPGLQKGVVVEKLDIDIPSGLGTRDQVAGAGLE